MPTSDRTPEAADRHPRSRHRWLLGFEPFFEGGWFHKEERAQSWDVEEELGALALLGDVTIDLVNAKGLPSVVDVQAYAIGRDVDVLVRPGTRAELSGRAGNGHLNSSAVSVDTTEADHLVRITGHTFLGDVTVTTVGTAP
jgi:hypothetical protein